jgi:hypothetical protein
MLKPFTLFLSLTLLSIFQFAFATQNFALIKERAQLADATYIVSASDDQLEKRLTKMGHELIHQAVIPRSQVSYFLTLKEGVQTIAIRGTANAENVMLDLDLALQPDPKLNILLHQGFAAAARAVFENVKPYLKTDKKVQTTGHSLGGAVAVILAMYLQQDESYQFDQVISFGQPKVTNVAGANRFETLALTRVVTPQDIVPLVPPLSPLQIQDLDIYWHMGEEVILMGDKEYAQTNGLKSMLRATKFTSALPNEDNVLAHQMSTYLALIDELLISPKEVPYKMQINVFGFSFD